MSRQSTQFSTIHAPLFKDERATMERIDKFISKDHFLDCNLRGRLYGETCAMHMTHVDCGLTRPAFEIAKRAIIERGTPVSCGFTFGPTWSTHWFKLNIDFPSDWTAKNVRIRFDAGCEAMFWSEDGRPLQGLSPDFGRTDLLLDEKSPIPAVLYVEAAANDRQGNGDGGMIEQPKPDCTFTITRCEAAIFHRQIYDLLMDLEIMLEMAKLLPKDGVRRYQALYTANDMINELVMSDFSPQAQTNARTKAHAFFAQRNGDSQFALHAIANCHIDTAWLWPYAETKRKCARSWSAALRLIERYPQLNFAVSQAQQLVWLRELYPSVYEEIQAHARNGRFNGVGGAWVEMDGNMPSGESMIRQLLYGQREFKKMLGKTSTVFWLPDTFGYSAQMPQILSICGMHRFVTQKMSWSFVNKFPNHSFWWTGIDGTRVLAHFPPNTYTAQVTVSECLDSMSNFTDRGRSNKAMILYGHGDGGGGPDENMMERIIRLENCDGIPTVVPATPESFFEELEEDADNLCHWNGELFLELHNATYTTQANVKKNNRFCEFLLRDQEFLQSAMLLRAHKFSRLASQWQRVLLNQFHDVLPGTSIHQAIADALEIYENVKNELLVTENVLRLEPMPGVQGHHTSDVQAKWVINSLHWPRTILHNAKLVTVPPTSVVEVDELDTVQIASGDGVRIEQHGDTILMHNKYLHAVFDTAGRIHKLRAKDAEGNTVEFVTERRPLNQFVIFHDVPLYWDAWDCMDYHLETRQEITQETYICSVEFELQISATSKLRQRISLRADQAFLTMSTTVDWNESHRFLKVEFPTNLRVDEAIYDIQFGYVKRPAHRNTSWDAARYEVCGHKWAAVCEYDQGLAVINDSKYGHSCEGGMLRLSLLRAPKAPDRTADIGQHQFRYAIFPFTGSLQRPTSCKTNVPRVAYEFNIPTRFVDGPEGLVPIRSWMTIENAEGIIIDCIKPAEDCDRSLIVRMFEAFGGKAAGRLVFREVAITAVEQCDALEAAYGGNLLLEGDTKDGSPSVALEFRPFQVRTVIVRLK